ncbi:MAG: DUF1987 domain-containing protein [Cytophagales bacterium]|nr:DUF1987 domain-containing protein [Cytophagales bacterium]
MEILSLKKTEHTPKVELDPDKGTLDFEGRSIPRDAKEFYIPIFEWLEEYIKNPQPKTSVKIYIDYFNTGSSVYLSNLFKRLNVLYESGNEVSVQWLYDEDDEDIQTEGEMFKQNINAPFEIVMVKGE